MPWWFKVTCMISHLTIFSVIFVVVCWLFGGFFLMFFNDFFLFCFFFLIITSLDFYNPCSIFRM